MPIIKVVSKPYKDLNVLDNIVAYAIDVPVESLNENISTVKWLGYGVNTLTPQHMISSFKTTKRLFGKDNGKQIYHFVLSYIKEII